MEQTTLHPPLIWERACSWLGGKLREYRAAVIPSLIVGFLCYLFAMTNKLVNHDEMYMLFSKGATFKSGRWGLALAEAIFPNYSMPWIYGILAIVLVTAASCLILNVLKIRTPLVQGLTAALLMASPTLIGTMAYMFTVAPYALSLLLAVTAVWLLTRETRRDALAALGLMIFSLSIYQAYVAMAASLLVLLVIRQLLEGRDLSQVLRRGMGYVVFLILALGGYYGATQVINRLVGVSFGGYAQGNMSFDLVSLPGDVLLAYQRFFLYFTEHYRGLVYTPLSQIAHGGLLLGTGVLLALWGWKKDWGRIAMLAAMIGLLPLAINCMYLFTGEDAVHTLTLYSFASVYLLGAMGAEQWTECRSAMAGCVRQAAAHLLPLAMAAIVAVNVYVANLVYLNLHLRYENAYAFYTALMADMKQQPGFDADTKLALVGSYRIPEFYFEAFPRIDAITGTTGFLPDNYSRDAFLEYYLGLKLPMAAPEETESAAALEEVRQMPCYPYYGSTKLIGDLFVVKLS